MTPELIDHINRFATEGDPFLFIINYQGNDHFISKLTDINPQACLYDFEGITNADQQTPHPLPCEIEWQVNAPTYTDYQRRFAVVKNNILAGNSFLTNLTCKVPISSNLTLDDIFYHAQGKYKLLLKGPAQQGKHFVCFSPETFLRIKNGRIYSYPMKGTIDATIPHADEVLMNDPKEAAEHATIVDLIRNDLSRVAHGVRVDTFRYIDMLHTHKGNILQTSSEISGLLPTDYPQHLGQIIAAQLPAGSITGAPKNKTMEIIHEAEGYDRGFYTGVMGIYNKGELNSAVIIRFVEQDVNQFLSFKAGGGITSMSDCQKEYTEVLQKIYLPFLKK